ncbi:MAG: hypothetical protein Q9160_007332 [Pyrenula sp. 1 TL-2023]
MLTFRPASSPAPSSPDPALTRSPTGVYKSAFLDRTSSADTRNSRPFRLRPGLTVHMFSTEPPCGDASMESVMDARGPDGAVPWTRGPEDGTRGSLQGRGYFSELGVVRRKPARGDAEVSLSKSCSDKLAMRECLGVFNAVVGALVERVWLRSLVLPWGKGEEEAMKRAFGKEGRLRSLNHWNNAQGFSVKTFALEVLRRECPRFAFEKSGSGQCKAGNVASIWIAGRNGEGTEACEVLINGVRQGHKQSSEDIRKASVICRENTWRKGREVTKLLGQIGCREGTVDDLQPIFSAESYAELKEKLSRSGRSRAKEVVIGTLGRWHENRGDEAWGLNDSDDIG